MHLATLFRSLPIAGALLFAPALLHAQFQAPNPDEYKMTADPKAPGADAVYFDVEENTDDPLHFHSFYARIKVLTEKGKELANVELPYYRTNNKITDIKGRTIQPDGTVVPLVGKPEDLLVASKGEMQFGKMVFTLPAVQVGSVLEYRYEVRYDDNHYSSPQWEIQRPFFVHQAHYKFTPFKGFLPGLQNATSTYLLDEHGNPANSLIWWPILPPGAQVKTDAAGHFSVDVADIPPIPHEEWMPPLDSVLYKVDFYYKSASNAGDFWVSEAKRWSKDVDHFAEPTRPIHDAVATLVAPGDSDTDKAKKLYKAVQALDNTDFSRRKDQVELKQLGLHVAKRAEDTWAQKSGSREDIAMLYLSLVRAAGLTAYPMKVVDRERGLFDPTYMSINQLNDTIIVLSLEGKDVVVDPGEKMCPFQTLHWRHAAAGGMRESPDGRSAATSPQQAYTVNTLTRTGDVTLDEHGAVTGYFRFSMTGQNALTWRQTAIRTDPDELKKRFDEYLHSIFPTGIDAHLDHFLGLEDPDLNLMAVVKAEGTLGTATSKRLLLPGFFFQTKGSHPFVSEEKRLEPVDMRYADQVTDQITYHFPPTFTVEGAPQTAQIPWTSHAIFATKTVPGSGQITVARQLTRGFTFVKAAEYQDLHDFYQKVAAADQQQLVLAHAPAAAGN
jgi:hypothetical protein